MVEYILGNFLVERGKINKEQLSAALEQMNGVRVKLGLIAISEGFMTTEQADTVNRLQTICDKRFGDIAVEKGYLTDDQVGKLLKQQGNSFFMFTQTLVDMGLVEMEEIDGIIETFRKVKGFSYAEMEDIKSDEVERIVPLLVNDDAKDFQELAGVAIRSLVRLIDRRVHLGKAEIISEYKTEACVTQELAGDNGMFVTLAESNGGLLRISSVFGQEEFEKVDEDALDAAGEFLNCMNGLFVSARSRDGQFLELMPPIFDPDGRKVEGKICKIPIYIQDQEFYLVVAA